MHVASSRERDEHRLDQWERAEYRKHSGLLQYVANDRFKLKYSVDEARRDAARPTMVSRRMVKRIVRYLKSVPRAVLCFGWCERSETLVVTVDADHAGCTDTRRSTSGGVIQVNGHVLGEWSTTQSTVALSSGESEFVWTFHKEPVERARLVYFRECGQVRLIGGSWHGIKARSRETVEAPGDQVFVHSALDQRWLGGVGDGSHEGEHR